MRENTGFVLIPGSVRRLIGPERLFFTPLPEFRTRYAG
jgi:hypothetical protein